jgi:hypothetical protein
MAYAGIQPKPLPMREWLELGQAMTDLGRLPPKYFRPYHTHMIEIGPNMKIKADGRIYRSGRYCLNHEGIPSVIVAFE